jgi:hypothetical protein
VRFLGIWIIYAASFKIGNCSGRQSAGGKEKGAAHVVSGPLSRSLSTPDRILSKQPEQLLKYCNVRKKYRQEDSMRKVCFFLCISIALTWSLLGCSHFGSNKTPDCNDDETKAIVVKRLFLNIMNSTVQQKEGRNYLDSVESLKGTSGEFKDPKGDTVKYRYSGGVLDVVDNNQDFRIGLQNIKTVNVDKNTGKCECTAQATNDFFENGQKTDQGSVTTISYTSAVAADGKGRTVEIK